MRRSSPPLFDTEFADLARMRKEMAELHHPRGIATPHVHGVAQAAPERTETQSILAPGGWLKRARSGRFDPRSPRNRAHGSIGRTGVWPARTASTTELLFADRRSIARTHTLGVYARFSRQLSLGLSAVAGLLLAGPLAMAATGISKDFDRLVLTGARAPVADLQGDRATRTLAGRPANPVRTVANGSIPGGGGAAIAANRSPVRTLSTSEATGRTTRSAAVIDDRVPPVTRVKPQNPTRTLEPMALAVVPAGAATKLPMSEGRMSLGAVGSRSSKASSAAGSPGRTAKAHGLVDLGRRAAVEKAKRGGKVNKRKARRKGRAKRSASR